MRSLLRNSITTPDGTVLVSRHRHDYVEHLDANGEKYIIDGGNDYVRGSVNKIQATDRCLYTDTPHEILREELVWGTYGEDASEELHYIKIKDMETAHIKAIIRERQGSDDYRTMFISELKERERNVN